MKENLEWEIWKEKESSNSVMEEDMKETSKTERKTVKEPLFGPMETNILEAGETISNTVSVSTIMSKMEARNKESGSTAKDISGYLDNLTLFLFFVK